MINIFRFICNDLKYLLFGTLFISGLNSYGQLDGAIEAEDAILNGAAEVTACSNASGGKMVKGIDANSANTLLFDAISVPEAGEYFIILSYYSVNERDFSYKLNNGSITTQIVPPSGDWCYQGGLPGKYIFKETFENGNNALLFQNAPIIDKIEVTADTSSRQPASIFVSSSTGNDSNNGFSQEEALQTLEAVNEMTLVPGDSLHFKSGDVFKGELIINNEGGTSGSPVWIGSYGNGELPVFDGDGFLASVQIINSGYLHLSKLEIRNNGGPAREGEPEDLRYGIYFQNTFSDGKVFKHYRLNKITFKNIYPTIEVTDDDKTGVNAFAINTTGSWGDDIHPTRFEDMLIEDCLFTRTARHATYFKAVENLVIKNNLFEHVGGAGMVVGNNCTNILVDGNTTNYTGSKIDNRMAGRGSGIWCFRSKNLTVQNNRFMHAHGIHDSYGMHIDIGNRNVVYQYNYSEDNEGGFVEILGSNVNVGYRYNMSVGDGWRKRGNQYGQIFWISGWSGDPKNPIGSDSVFVYNNSVYVRDTVAPGINIVAVTKNTRIYNNIVYASNSFGPVRIENDPYLNDFSHNTWFGPIPMTDEDGEEYRGDNSQTSDPMFSDVIITEDNGFQLQLGSPAISSGKLVHNSSISHPFDYFYNNGGKDFFGNPVSSQTPPNRGAYNGEGVAVYASELFNGDDEIFTVYPNPIERGYTFEVSFPSSLKGKNITFQLVDISGRIRKEKSFPVTEKIKIGTGDIERGLYMLRIYSADRSAVRNLIIY